MDGPHKRGRHALAVVVFWLVFAPRSCYSPTMAKKSNPTSTYLTWQRTPSRRWTEKWKIEALPRIEVLPYFFAKNKIQTPGFKYKKHGSSQEARSRLSTHQLQSGSHHEHRWRIPFAASHLGSETAESFYDVCHGHTSSKHRRLHRWRHGQMCAAPIKSEIINGWQRWQHCAEALES